MRRFSLALSLALLALAAADAAAQGMTRVRRLHGSDRRGQYDLRWIALTERFANAAVRARVNADLEREAREHLCQPGDAPVGQLSSEFEMAVTYVDSRLLGVRTGEFVACGGAHPSFGPGALLYDLRTGRRIDLEGEMTAPRAFHRFVAQRAADAAPGGAGECTELYTADQLSGDGFIYYLEARVVRAVPDYPQVVLACGFDTEIPHADIIRFLKPGSPLRWLAQRRR